MPPYVVARVDEVPPGKRRIVDVAGRSIGIFNVDGAFYALRNRCPHQGGALCTGPLLGQLRSGGPGEYEYSPEQQLIQCPWHGWEFDLRTGQSYFDPARMRVRRYAVDVVPGAAVVGNGDGGPERTGGRLPGPYRAETFEISVEDDYLVVDVST